MTTTLDITALYGGTLPNGRFQQRSRERMTVAAYNDARNNRTCSSIWAIVAVAHLMVVLFAFGLPGFTSELAANPGYVLGLVIWLAGDVVYLAFYPKIHNHYQTLVDRLEGKVPSRR